MKELKKYLSNRREIVFAYLYGSRARRTDGKLSDIDLAVYIDKQMKPASGVFGYKSELITELQSLLNKEVDLVVLNDVSVLLGYNVLRDGKLLYCRSETERVNFHDSTMRKYLDFVPMFKVQDYYLKQRLKEGRYGR